MVPPIPGLKDAPYLTNATLFNLTILPPRLAIIGAGPIGCEMAQAFARFGSAVTVVDMLPQPLGPEDRDAAQALRRALEEDGVRFLMNAKCEAVEHSKATAGQDWPCIVLRASVSDTTANGKTPSLEGIECDALLVACG